MSRDQSAMPQTLLALKRRSSRHANERRSAPLALAASRVAAADSAARSRKVIRGWFVFALITFSLLIASRSFGQAAGKYKSDPLPERLTAKAAVSAMERAKAEGLTKGDLSPQWSNFPALQAYYQQYLFGKLRDASYVQEYGKIAQSMLDDLERCHRARTPAAKLLSSWIVSGASAISANNYHPAARVNATLLLAHVDEQAANPRSGSPPVPSADALIPLVQLYRSDSAPDGVKAAALQGLLRHVSLGAVTNRQHQAGIASLMLRLAESSAPDTRSPEAHAFMQRYAIDILSHLANPNTSAKTAETLVSLSTGREKPSLIAAYAASKVGQLQAGQAKVEQPSQVLKSWAARAADTLDRELDRIARLDPPTAVRDQPAMPSARTPRGMGPGGGGYEMGGEMPEMDGDYMGDYGGMDMEMPTDMYMEGGGYGEMMGPGGGMGPPKAKPQPLEIVTSRRAINHVLQQLVTGVVGQAKPAMPSRLAGIAAVAPEADKAAISGWIKTVKEAVDEINDETLDDRKKFVEALQKHSESLKKLAGIEVKPAAGPSAPSGPGPVVPASATSDLDILGPPGANAGQAGPGQPAPGPLAPGQPNQGQPNSGQPAPGQPMPGQPASGQPAAGQPMPGQPAPGPADQGPAAAGGPLPAADELLDPLAP